MTSHELARYLLELPDRPVSVIANNHQADENIRLAAVMHRDGHRVLIGNYGVGNFTAHYLGNLPILLHDVTGTLTPERVEEEERRRMC